MNENGAGVGGGLPGSRNEESCGEQSNFVTALRKKFDHQDDQPLQFCILIAKSPPRKTDSGDLLIPERLALSRCGISSAGPMLDIRRFLGNVTELDLSVNNLSEWSEVFSIISHLPKIHFLNISNNPLHRSHDIVVIGSCAQHELKPCSVSAESKGQDPFGLCASSEVKIRDCQSVEPSDHESGVVASGEGACTQDDVSSCDLGSETTGSYDSKRGATGVSGTCDPTATDQRGICDPTATDQRGTCDHAPDETRADDLGTDVAVKSDGSEVVPVKGDSELVSAQGSDDVKHVIVSADPSTCVSPIVDVKSSQPSDVREAERRIDSVTWDLASQCSQHSVTVAPEIESSSKLESVPVPNLESSPDNESFAILPCSHALHEVEPCSTDVVATDLRSSDPCSHDAVQSPSVSGDRSCDDVSQLSACDKSRDFAVGRSDGERVEDDEDDDESKERLSEGMKSGRGEECGGRLDEREESSKVGVANRLVLPYEDEAGLMSDGRFTLIKQLVLNFTKLTWTTVLKLLSIMPRVEELHLSYNDYSSVDVPCDGPSFTNITDVYFNGNLVTCWKEMEKFDHLFPNLANLIMMENPIASLSAEASVDAQFKRLKCLCLTRTAAKDWKELEQLNRFSSLTDVKVLGIPFLQKTEEKLRRKLLIGYLPQIERLNGSSVSTNEREDAERAFIRHYMNVKVRPTRYDTLESKHGKLCPLVNIDLSVSGLVCVTIQFNDKTILKQLSVHTTASQLKQMLSKEVVGRPPRTFALYHNNPRNLGSEIMSFPDRTLLNYRVEDGDEIICELKA